MKKLVKIFRLVYQNLNLTLNWLTPVFVLIAFEASDVFLLKNGIEIFNNKYWANIIVMFAGASFAVLVQQLLGKIEYEGKTDDLYYIRTQGFIGNGLVWWRPNEAGYTSDINKAGTYTYDEAYSICKGTHGDNMAYKCSTIDNMEEGLTLQVHSDYAPKPDIGTHFGEEIQ